MQGYYLHSTYIHISDVSIPGVGSGNRPLGRVSSGSGIALLYMYILRVGNFSAKFKVKDLVENIIDIGVLEHVES